MDPGVFPYLNVPCRIDRGDTKKNLARNEYIAGYVESFEHKVDIEKFTEKQKRDRQAKEGKDLPFHMRWEESPEHTSYGVKLEEFPPAMSSAPFLYMDLSLIHI